MARQNDESREHRNQQSAEEKKSSERAKDKGSREKSKRSSEEGAFEDKKTSKETSRKDHGKTKDGKSQAELDSVEKDGAKDKHRPHKLKVEGHESRHHHDSGKEARKKGSDDRIDHNEVRSSKSREKRKEERSKDKNKKEDGTSAETHARGEERARRRPLEPTESNAVELLDRKSSKVPVCEVCEHRDATLWCGDCGDIFYCQKCADTDHSRGKRKEHLPLRPAEKAPQRTATRLVRCEEHGEILRAYCETDRKAVCSLCLHIGNHKGHSAIELDKAVRAARDSIRKEAGDLTVERQKVDTFLDELEEIAESLKKNGGELREHLRASCEAFRAVLTEREAALLVQVDERESEKTGIISRQRLRWKDTVSEVNKARELAEAALKEVDPVVLLKKRDTFEQQAHALRIASARRNATPATTASLELALEADPIVSMIRESLVFRSGAGTNRASSVIARLQQAQNKKASLTDNTVIVLPRACLEVARVTPNLSTQSDGSALDAWIGRLWELREHLDAPEASRSAVEISRTKPKRRKDASPKENEAAVTAARKIQALWRGASLRKANSLDVLKAFRGSGIRGSAVYAHGASSDGVDERYVKVLANLGCLVILTGPLSDPTGTRSPPIASRTSLGESPLRSWLEGQERDDVTDKRATNIMAAQIHHLVKALPASIRQSNLFLMGHGPGGDLISRVKAQGSLTEMVTGTILSGCEQAGKGVGGNVLALSFADSEAVPKSFDDLLAGEVNSSLAASLPDSTLEDGSVLKDGVFRELLLTFLCKPQRVHLLDKLWETEPHLAKQLTVTARRGNALAVSIQPTGRKSHRKRNGAPSVATADKSASKDERNASTKKLERSASISSEQEGKERSSEEGQKGRESEAAGTSSGKPGLEEIGGVPHGVSSLTGTPLAPGASPIPTPDQNANQNLAPSSSRLDPTPQNPVGPTSVLPPSTAANGILSSQPGSTLSSNQAAPEQPSSLASRPSFSGSSLRPPTTYTPGSSYTPSNPSNLANPANPANPANAANLASAYAPSTTAPPLSSALGSSYGRSGVDASARPPQLPTGSYVPGASAGLTSPASAYVPGASAGRLGQSSAAGQSAGTGLQRGGPTSAGPAR